MDFGKPDNARTINRLKVLTALRNNSDMSCAELSRLLLINKVSIGEIVKGLMAEGLVEETGKITVPSGRPAIKIDIAWNKGSVLALSDDGRHINMAQCNLRGKTIRLERFTKGASDEETATRFHSAMLRIKRNSTVKIWGAVMASGSDWSWLSDTLSFPMITEDPMKCITAAELARSGGALYQTLFVDLGEHVSASWYDGNIRILPDFRHLRVSNGRTCSCGRTGCLDTMASLSAFREAYDDIDPKEPFRDPVITARMKQCLDPLAFAISESLKILGGETCMLTGTLSAMPDEFYPLLTEKTKSLLPEERGLMIYKSLAGGSAVLEGAARLALDEWFFRTPLILKLSELERF